MRDSELPHSSRTPFLPGWVVAAGLGTALIAGCLDAFLSIRLAPPNGLLSGTNLLLVVGMTALVTLAGFLAGFLALRTLPGAAPGPLAAALAVLALLSLTLLSFARVPDASPAGLTPPWWAARACLALAAAAAAFFLARAVPALGRREAWARFGLAGPALAGAALLALWLAEYRGVPGKVAALAALIPVALALAVASRLRSPAAAGRWLAGGALLVAGVALWGSRGEALEAPPRRHTVPRVVVISIDTLRADEVSAYGQGAARTPHLDALARDAVLFSHAYSAAPWTVPALASVMTGLPPNIHMARHLNDRVPDRVITAAEALRRAGYHTSALISNPVLAPPVNLSQGFDEYTISSRPWMGHSFGATVVTNLFLPMRSEKPSTPALAELAVRWLGEHRDGDFFLWVHFLDPHAPYEPPRPYLDGRAPPAGAGWRFDSQDRLALPHGDGSMPAIPAGERAWVRRLYRGEVRYVDDFVGSVIRELERLGMYDGALVVLLSDHGEEFWEHGGIGHGTTLYDEQLHVPLMIKLPGSTRRGRIDAPVSTASLARTLLDLCSLPIPPDYPAAESLLPLLAGGRRSGPLPPLLSLGIWRQEERSGVRFGHHKYVRWEVSGKEELYDLARDPGEQVNQAALAPAALAEGRRLLARFDAEGRQARHMLHIAGPEMTRPDAGTVEQLRALGYIR